MDTLGQQIFVTPPPRNKGIFVVAAIFVAVLAGGMYIGAKTFWGGGDREENPPIDDSTPVDDSSSGEPASVSEQLALQTKIKKFKDYEELRSFIEDNAAVGSMGYYDGMTMLKSMPQTMMPLAEGSLMDSGVGLSRGEDSGAAVDYSTTNVQVAGVDEADLIKTDGKYIYAVAGNKVYVVEAYPTENANIVSSIDFGSQPQNIYLNGNSLVVFGSDDQPFLGVKRMIDEGSMILPPSRFKAASYFKVYDISNKEKPALIRDLTFEGQYLNSRMIGNYVYFLTKSFASDLDDESPVPGLLDKGVPRPTRPGEPHCYCPDVYYFDIPYRTFALTTVAAINVSQNDQPVKSEVYLLGDGQQLYVSQKNIYIAYTKYVSEMRIVYEPVRDLMLSKLNQKSRDRVVAIESASSAVLSEEEKMIKIFAIFEHYLSALNDQSRKQTEDEIEKAIQEKYRSIADELEKTVIHKIAIAGEELKYQNFGEVPGHIINQFSMDEQGEYFRIATTRSDQWMAFGDNDEERLSANHLFVLDADMKIIGSLKDLARGERIYSVRFLGNRGYVVTFKRIDPLFVIDLKDPRAPAVLGELKVPGFSTYLHPYDENTIIGFGQNTAENEWGGTVSKGLKLSLFDVTDGGRLREIAKYDLGEQGSYSEAQNDHRAFLFSFKKNLLVVPVSLRESGGEGVSANKMFSGAAVFAVTKDGFTLKGKISHSEEASANGLIYVNLSAIRRSRYIEDTLYTLSNNYLQANRLDNLERIKQIKIFEGLITQPPPIVPPTPLLIPEGVQIGPSAPAL